MLTGHLQLKKEKQGQIWLFTSMLLLALIPRKRGEF